MGDLVTQVREVLVADAAQRDGCLSGALTELTETEARVLRLAASLMHRLADLNS